MSGVWQSIRDGFATASGLDLLNLALGLTGVALMVRRSLWAFPVGLVAVSVQGVLLWRSQFPADALLQVFYFGTLAWGWWHWVKHKGAAAELPITRLPPKGLALAILAAGVATTAWALTVGPWMKAVMPWRDAFIAAFSVAAQVLQVRKNLENWALWAVVNLVAIASYWSAELAFTAFLYGVYLVLGLIGWWQWAAARRRQA